jgi:hypothetical protein
MEGEGEGGSNRGVWELGWRENIAAAEHRKWWVGGGVRGGLYHLEIACPVLPVEMVKQGSYSKSLPQFTT